MEVGGECLEGKDQFDTDATLNERRMEDGLKVVDQISPAE